MIIAKNVEFAGSNKDGKDSGSASSSKKKEDRNDRNKDDADSKKDKDSTDGQDVKMKDEKGGKDGQKKQSTFPAATTTDAVRLKCRELLASALGVNGTTIEGCASPEELAEELEEAIFAEFKNTDNRYKNRVSSQRVFFNVFKKKKFFDFFSGIDKNTLTPLNNSKIRNFD